MHSCDKIQRAQQESESIRNDVSHLRSKLGAPSTPAAAPSRPANLAAKPVDNQGSDL